MNETLYQALTFIFPLVFAIVFHEVAHGWAAKALGDPTAAMMGRLSLNPFRHVDPVGTIVVPGLLALASGPIFGWAKPVPVVAQRMRNPRLGMMLSAAAGPAANFIMAIFAAIGIGLMTRAFGEATSSPGEPWLFIWANLNNFLVINIFLALFNLLPIPPFDGSHIVEGLLPEPLARHYAGLRRYGFMLVLIVLVMIPWLIPSFNPVASLIGPPFEWVIARYLTLAAVFAG